MDEEQRDPAPDEQGEQVEDLDVPESEREEVKGGLGPVKASPELKFDGSI